MTTATENESVYQLIDEYREQANGNFVYAECAEWVYNQISAEQAREYSIRGIQYTVGQRMARLRPSTNGTTRPRPKYDNGSTKWDEVREMRDALEDWWVARGGKTILDCGASDLEKEADLYEEKAVSNAARAESFRKCARKIRREGVTTLRELPREWVRNTLDA